MRNPEFDNRVSFTGKITGIRRLKASYHVTIAQKVAGVMPTEFRLVVPTRLYGEEGFPFTESDSVLIQDATLYQKGAEMRLRITAPSQIRVCAEEGLINSLSFSGQIIENKREKDYRIVLMRQTVENRYETTLEILVTKNVESPLKPGEIGYIKSVLFYEKDGTFRARLERPEQYSLLYSPDKVMELARIEAKERFA